jgi:hypothetical protein
MVALMAVHRAVSSQSDESCAVFDQTAVTRMKRYLVGNAAARHTERMTTASVTEHADGRS